LNLGDLVFCFYPMRVSAEWQRKQEKQDTQSGLAALGLLGRVLDEELESDRDDLFGLEIRDAALS
jgi:hypothetical protein